MINGESYKWIVAEAAKKALGMDRIQERVFIVRLVNDKNDPNRIAGAVGFSVREHKLYIYKFKACLLVAGGAVNVFRPRSVGEGTGRAWYPVWNAGSTYSMAAEAGAELTMMENRFVPARFKDGYGPVGAWFLLFKAKVDERHGRRSTTPCNGDLHQGREALRQVRPGRAGHLPAQPHHAEGDERRPRPDLHGHRRRRSPSWART